MRKRVAQLEAEADERERHVAALSSYATTMGQLALASEADLAEYGPENDSEMPFRVLRGGR